MVGNMYWEYASATYAHEVLAYTSMYVSSFAVFWAFDCLLVLPSFALCYYDLERFLFLEKRKHRI